MTAPLSPSLRQHRESYEVNMFTNINLGACGIEKAEFKELARLAAKYGIEGIDVPAGAFSSVQEAKEAGYYMASLGLQWGLVPTPSELYSEEYTEEQFVETAKEIEGIAQRAAAAGCTRAYNHIWPGSNTMEYDKHYEWIHRRVSTVAKIFYDNGIQYALECVGPHTLASSYRYPFFNNYIGMIGFADDIGYNVGLVYDTFHWYCMGAKRDDLTYFMAHIDRVVNFHVNDALPVPMEEQQDLQRGMPLEHGIIDAVYITRKFIAAGYKGPVIAEPLWPWLDKYKELDNEGIVKLLASQYTDFFDKVGMK